MIYIHPCISVSFTVTSYFLHVPPTISLRHCLMFFCPLYNQPWMAIILLLALRNIATFMLTPHTEISYQNLPSYYWHNTFSVPNRMCFQFYCISVFFLSKILTKVLTQNIRYVFFHLCAKFQPSQFIFHYWFWSFSRPNSPTITRETNNSLKTDDAIFAKCHFLGTDEWERDVAFA